MDPENYGEPRYIDTFQLTPQCQRSMYDVCEEFEASAKYSDLIKRKDGVGSVSCFLAELGPYWVEMNYNATDEQDVSYCELVRSPEIWKKKYDWTVPVENMTTEFMKGFLESRSCLDNESP